MASLGIARVIALTKKSKKTKEVCLVNYTNINEYLKFVSGI